MPELTRELSEGLASTLLLFTICDILPFLILTVILSIACPLLAPTGIIPMIVPIKSYFKKLKQLDKFS
ncbi:MAG TPA: hypothetical protein DDZ80_05370 [Cyanobacteria bacterium UBA8803]|nr:hypothetical protein [Cyanobacteria bacterium UBA9273]HBL57974.1 hypothetical protein [Cyanobacteria bacterium UBA8803]